MNTYMHFTDVRNILLSRLTLWKFQEHCQTSNSYTRLHRVQMANQLTEKLTFCKRRLNVRVAQDCHEPETFHTKCLVNEVDTLCSLVLQHF